MGQGFSFKGGLAEILQEKLSIAKNSVHLKGPVRASDQQRVRYAELQVIDPQAIIYETVTDDM